MTNLFRPLAALLLGVAALTARPLPAVGLTLERIFAAPDLSGASLRSPRFSPDGRFVTYLQGRADDKDRLDLWAWDVARHRAGRLVDAAAIAEGTDPRRAVANSEEEQRCERQRTSSLSGIVDYQFSADSRRLLFPIDGDL